MKILVFFAFSLIPLYLISQNNGTNQIFSSAELSVATVNLRCKVDSSIRKENSGSGIFVTNESRFYILTAAHVAKTMGQKTYIIICGKNDRPIKLNLFEITKSIKWNYHKTADLALIELHLTDFYFQKYFQKRFLPLEYFIKDTIATVKDTQLTIIGFPLGLGATDFFSPLTYHSYPSSGLITLKRADTHTPQTFIVLENPSVEGYSGAPVFDISLVVMGNVQMAGNGTKCVGIIHGTIPDATGGKLTAMTPSFYVYEFFKGK